MPTNDIRFKNAPIPMCYDGIAGSRAEAVGLLSSFDQWRVGLIMTIPYQVANQNNTDKNRALVAVGIKDSNSSGSGGNTDENDNLDTTDVNGPEFYQLIGDFSESAGGGTSTGLDITTVVVNGKEYEVVNANGRPERISDPFTVKEIRPNN